MNCSPLLQIVLVTATVVSYVCLLLGFALPFWSESTLSWSNFSFIFNNSEILNNSRHSNKSVLYFGLWTTCYKFQEYFCVGDDIQNTFHHVYDWVTSIKILLGIALITGIVPCLPFSCKTFTNVCHGFVYIGTCVLIFISISIYAANYKDPNDVHSTRFSYIVTIISAVGYLLLGIIHCLMYKHRARETACKSIFCFGEDSKEVPMKLKISISIMIVTFLLQEVNFALPFWIYNNSQGVYEAYENSIMKCITDDRLTCCGVFSMNIEFDSLKAPGSFYILWILLAITVFMGVIHIVHTYKWILEVSSRITLSVFLSAFNGILIVVFTVAYSMIAKSRHTQDYSWFASFYISISLATGYMVNALWCCCVMKSQKGNTPQEDKTKPYMNPAFEAVNDDSPSDDVSADATSTESPRNTDNELPYTKRAFVTANDDLSSDDVPMDAISTESTIKKETVMIHSNSYEFPTYWEEEEMSSNKVAFDVKQNSEEYREVADLLKTTIESGKYEIICIQRIQNKRLYGQYAHLRDNMNSTKDKESRLWHGTSLDAVQKINKGGFNRSYCGKNGTVYGQGVYFARKASYSSSSTYSPKDKNGNKWMYLCRVLTGDYVTGNEYMKEPPEKENGYPYNSVVDSTRNPSIFVVFRDNEAYPEYLVEFRDQN